MELSVIIVSYNVSSYLRNCLDSVIKASSSLSCEIIVVDNNSADGSVSMVSEAFPQVVVIANNENKGFSAACNQAIKVSSGKFILLLNPDTVIPLYTLEKCISFMNEHNDAGLLGVRLADEDGIFLPESKRSFPSPAAAFFKITGMNRLFPDSTLFNRYYFPSIKNNQAGKVEVIPGAFMFLREEALRNAGGLDEDYFMYGEDIELSYKIRKAGYSTYYFPDVTVTHYKGRSTPRTGYADIFHFYGAMRIYVKKRHAGKPDLQTCLILSAIYFIESLAIARRFFRNLFHS